MLLPLALVSCSCGSYKQGKQTGSVVLTQTAGMTCQPNLKFLLSASQIVGVSCSTSCTNCYRKSSWPDCCYFCCCLFICLYVGGYCLLTCVYLFIYFTKIAQSHLAVLHLLEGRFCVCLVIFLKKKKTSNFISYSLYLQVTGKDRAGHAE